MALTLSTIPDHIYHLHKSSKIQLDMAELTKVAKEFNIQSEMPKISGPIPRLHGLPLIPNCVRCPYCDKIYGKDSLRMHHSRDHPGTPTPTSLPTCFAQQLNRNIYKTLFQVIVTPKTTIMTPANTIIENLRKERDTIIRKYIPHDVDARAVSPWLLATGWHTHVAEYETDELIHLVKVPKNEDHLDKLSKAVLMLLEKGYGYLDQTSEIVLQKLNSADPAKDGSVFFLIYIQQRYIDKKYLAELTMFR